MHNVAILSRPTLLSTLFLNKFWLLYTDLSVIFPSNDNAFGLEQYKHTIV